jgi:hypothetical protein
MGLSSSAKRQGRARYLSKEQMEKPVAEGADQWLTGKSIQVEVTEVEGGRTGDERK